MGQLLALFAPSRFRSVASGPPQHHAGERGCARAHQGPAPAVGTRCHRGARPLAGPSTQPGLCSQKSGQEQMKPLWILKFRARLPEPPEEPSIHIKKRSCSPPAPHLPSPGVVWVGAAQVRGSGAGGSSSKALSCKPC